jgi:transposase
MSSFRSITGVSLSLLKDCVQSLPLKLWLPRRKSRVGRPPYSRVSLFLAYLVKIKENIPYDTALARELKDKDCLREFCGFKKDSIPSHDTFSRFFKLLTKELLLKIFSKVDTKLAELEVFDRDDFALDATDLITNPRNRHNPDPDAGYGYKTDGERFHGYWAVFVTGTQSEVVRSVEVIPANIHQSHAGVVVLQRLEKQDLRFASVLLADSAYDDRKTYHSCITLGLVPCIAYNRKRSRTMTFDDLPQRNWRKRSIGREGIRIREENYTKRGAVERYNSTFKELLNGRSLPVRGLEKACKYVLLVCILSQIYALANWIIQRRRIRYHVNTLLYYLVPAQ